MTIMDKELIDNNKKKKLKKKNKNKKKHTLLYKFISFLMIILTVATVCYIVYLEILPLNILIPVVGGTAFVDFIFSLILGKDNLRNWVKNIFSFLAIIIMIVCVLVLVYGMKTFKFLAEITDNGDRIDTYGVYVLNDSGYEKLSDLDGKKITYLNEEDDTLIREALGKIESKVSLEDDYEDTIEELVNAINENETDAIFFEQSYESVIKEEFEDTYDNLVMIDSVEMLNTVDTLKSNKDITKDAFAVYISGIDTTGKVASKARSDVNIIAAVNPKTHKILLVSTPRDSYVTLSSKQAKDKLTHAGLYGIEESVNTLSDLYDVDIDYYGRLNFTSFIDIINALGGVKVTIPKYFCEQNSNRCKQDYCKICLSKGTQNLNGEQALAYARNRHNFANGDFARGEHQMEIIEAAFKKAISPSIITKYSSLISALEGKVVTNMTSDEMVKFVKKQMKSDSTWDIESVSAKGTTGMGRCYSVGNANASIVSLDEDSVSEIQIMLDNLFEGKEDLSDGIVEETTTTTTSN